jgi:hypothetical protein
MPSKSMMIRFLFLEITPQIFVFTLFSICISKKRIEPRWEPYPNFIKLLRQVQSQQALHRPSKQIQ